MRGGLEGSENLGSCLGSPELILAPRLLIPHPVLTQGAAPLSHSLLQVSPRTSRSPSFQAFLLPPSSLLDPISVIYHKGTPWAREDGRFCSPLTQPPLFPQNLCASGWMGSGEGERGGHIKMHAQLHGSRRGQEPRHAVSMSPCGTPQSLSPVKLWFV